MEDFIPDFVFSADLHGAEGAWSNRPTIVGDSYASLRQIVDYCLQYRLPLVLGGDVIDTRRPPARTVEVYYREMSRMQEAGLPVYYVQGQHELDRLQPWLSVHPWPIWLNELLVPIGTLRCYGVDWQPISKVQERLGQIPDGADCLIAHQVWRDLMGDLCQPECAFSDVPKVQALLTGDFHDHLIADAAGKDGQPLRVFSPGSTCLQAINEQPYKKFFVIGRMGNQITASSVGLDTRPLLKYTITTPEQLDEFCQSLAQFPERVITADFIQDAPPHTWVPLAWVTYREDLPEVYDRLTAATSNRAHLFLKPIQQEQEVVVNFAAAPTGAFDSMVGALGQLSPPESPTYQGARRLLEATIQGTDPAYVLEEMYREHCNAIPNGAGTTGTAGGSPAAG